MTGRSAACRPVTGIEWAEDLAKDAREIVARNLKLLMGKQEPPMIPAELARRLGTNRSTVGAWLAAESGPEYKTLIPIAALFGVTVAELFVDEAEDVPPPRPPTDKVEEAMRAFADALDYEGTIRIRRRGRR